MACEILVTRGDRPGPPSDMRWSHGHPVLVRPRGTNWGREALPEVGKFLIIEVSDVDVRDLQPYLESMDVDEEGTPRRIRSWKIHLGDLPSGVQSILETQGRAVISYENIRGHVRNEGTGVPLPQNIGTNP